MARRKTTTRKARRDDGYSDDPSRDVKKVQAGDTEKGCAEEWRAPGVLEEANSLIDQTKPFADVQSRKDHAEKNGGPKEAVGFGLVAELCGIHSAEHGETASDERHSHYHYVENTGIELEGRGPITAGSAEIPVAKEKRTEGHGVRDDKQPHGELSGRNCVRRSFCHPAMNGNGHFGVAHCLPLSCRARAWFE